MCVYSRHFYDPYIPAIPGLEKFKGFPFLILHNTFLLLQSKSIKADNQVSVCLAAKYL